MSANDGTFCRGCGEEVHGAHRCAGPFTTRIAPAWKCSGCYRMIPNGSQHLCPGAPTQAPSSFEQEMSRKGCFDGGSHTPAKRWEPLNASVQALRCLDCGRVLETEPIPAPRRVDG